MKSRKKMIVLLATAVIFMSQTAMTAKYDDSAFYVEQPSVVCCVPILPEENTYTREEIELIALVTMAEAEGESEYGKRLVIDTILNRVEYDEFPDTVAGVIYQPNQFECLTNGRIDRCEVREDFVALVEEEIANRQNYACIFFNAGDYSRYGIPLFQVGGHYFSAL